MDVIQPNLRALLKETDRTFELVISHPSSTEYAHQYEVAKNALDTYLVSLRQSLLKKGGNR